MSKALAVFSGMSLKRGRASAVQVSDLVARQLEMRSNRTREAYGRDLRHFGEYVGCGPVEAIQRLVQSDAAIAQDVVLSFQSSLRKAGLSASTINRRIAALRSVMKIARAVGATSVHLDLVESLDVEEEARDVRGPGLEVIRKLIATCEEAGTRSGVRDATILRWLLVTGVRRNELRVLTMADYHPEPTGGRVMVMQKRKRRKRAMLLSPALVSYTGAWLDLRGMGPGALFSTLDRRARPGTTLDPSGLNKIIRRRAIEAGFPDGKLPDGRSITPHGLRHTAITEVIRKHGQAAAQSFARHANANTTQLYNDDKVQMALDGQRMVIDLLG